MLPQADANSRVSHQGDLGEGSNISICFSQLITKRQIFFNKGLGQNFVVSSKQQCGVELPVPVG